MSLPRERAPVASDASAVKKMRLRYAGRAARAASTFYDRTPKTVQCLVCPQGGTGPELNGPFIASDLAVRTGNVA